MDTKNKTVLVIDDEPGIVTLIERILKTRGFNVISAYNADDAINKYKQTKQVDLAIIDILLTDLSGIEILRHIRERDKDIPIIMISALNKAGPAVTSMQLGACDYITKPFNPEELIDKINKVLFKADVKKTQKHEVIRNDDLVIDLTQRVVRIADEQISLTNKEYHLLHLFLRFTGRLITRDYIVDEIWGNEFAYGSRTLDAHICSLRKKLKKHGERIITVSGEGYKYNGQ